MRGTICVRDGSLTIKPLNDARSNSRRPSRYWTQVTHQKQFFDALGKQIGIQTLDDWYSKVSVKLLRQNGGSGLLFQHGESPSSALMACYPEHNWIPQKFVSTPRDHWKDISNQRNFFDTLGKKLGITTLDDWYQRLSLKVLEENGGYGVLYHYKKSPVVALMSVYPEHNWIPWKFNFVPDGFWKVTDNQRKYIEWLGNELSVKQLDEWYHLFSVSTFHKHGGSSLLAHHKGSALSLFKTVYPQHNWIPWKFTSVPDGYWNSKQNVSQFLSELAEKLSINTLDDWYRVDMQQLKKFRAASVIYKHKGLYRFLKEQYPHHDWDPKRFQAKRGKSQRWLVVTLNKLFPGEDIIEDYQHPKASFPSTNRPMQLDVYIPSRSLAFEYQGKQHYEEVSVFSPLRTYQQRDEEKRALCIANNIKLIEVPYWWNRTQESLEQIIDTS